MRRAVARLLWNPYSSYMKPATGWVSGLALTVLCGLCLSQPWLSNVVAAQGGASRDSRELMTDISRSTDVAWLQRIAMSPEFAAELAAKLLDWTQLSVLRTAAYVRLGSIGTADSLAAIATIEAGMATRVTATETVNVDDWPREENGYGKGLAESVGPDGRTYRVVFWNLQGRYDLFLTSSRTPADRGSWTRPLPTGSDLDWPPPAVTITWRGQDTLLLRYTIRSERTRERSLSLAALLTDTDADGWTDEEERRLGLDPRRSDSDSDGIPDGADTCPLLPRSPNSDERSVAIQRVFLAEFGFSSRRQTLWVTSGPVHVFGYGAPVLFDHAQPPIRGAFDQRGATFVSWKSSQSGDEMLIEVTAWNNPRAAYGKTYVLKRFNDQWFVVGTRDSWIA
jgi:hypothetical protein